MSDYIKLEVTGEDKLIQAIERYPQQAQTYLAQAGDEVAKRVILSETGMQKYPGATVANQPGRTKTVNINGREATFRIGYYIRGRGWQAPARGGGYRSRGDSQRLGTQWKVKRSGAYGTEIGNRSSYAKWVHGEEQAGFMGPKGWRKLSNTVREKLAQITAVYQEWIDRLLKDLGL